MIILYNDQFLDQSDVSISFEDRGYNFGDGVYEVFRIYTGNIYEKQAHLDRLVKSAEEIRLGLPYSLQDLDEKLEKLLLQQQIVDGTLYLQITRGASPRAHTFPQNAEPVLIAYCKEVERPVQSLRDGIGTITLPDIRWQLCHIKSLNLLANVLAKQEAAERNAGEAIMHRDGIVTECSSSNAMIVKNGLLYTHLANHLILHGITRSVILRLSARLNLDIREKPFTLEDLYGADEAFITSTTMEIMPVVTVDGKTIGSGSPGPVTRQLQQAFEQTI